MEGDEVWGEAELGRGIKREKGLKQEAAEA